jgi:hypothetical protein
MYHVRVRVIRFVDDAWPGWVEAHLNEADGSVVSLIDKVPVLDAGGRLAAGGELPVELELSCDLLDRTVDPAGQPTAVIRLHHGVEDQAGRNVFRVAESALRGPP